MKALLALAAAIVVVFLISERGGPATATATAPESAPVRAVAVEHPAPLAGTHARAAAVAPRPEGGRPDRDARWAARMTRVHERARAELGVSETGAAALLELQTELRAFKHRVHAGVADGKLEQREADRLLSRRVERFEGAVGLVVGADQREAYFQIVKEVRLAQE